MDIRFKTTAQVIVLVLISAFPLLAQSGQGKPQQDIVEKLMPNGGWPTDLPVKPAQRDSIIKKLKVAQGTARAQRAQKVAFLLAALNVEYDRNRDYLFHVLSGCNYPEIRYNCDESTGYYLIQLYEHGHQGILAPLLKTSLGSCHAAGAEGLGGYFGDLVLKSPEKFLEAVNTFPVPTQKKICGFAGESDGGGLGAEGLAQARKKLRAIGSEVALRCLKEIEIANKHD
jgi:hypothetical protein